MGQIGGPGAVRLMRLVDGDGAGPSDAFSASVEISRNCLEAVSAALSNVAFQNFLPTSSGAAAALIQQYGPFYVFHEGFAYRALADGWLPHEDGKNTQYNVFLPLPPGHEICPDDEESRQVCIEAEAVHVRALFMKFETLTATCRSSPSTRGRLKSWLSKVAVATAPATAAMPVANSGPRKKHVTCSIFFRLPTVARASASQRAR